MILSPQPDPGQREDLSVSIQMELRIRRLRQSFPPSGALAN